MAMTDSAPLGTFEEQVMLAVLRTGDEAYGKAGGGLDAREALGTVTAFEAAGESEALVVERRHRFQRAAGVAPFEVVGAARHLHPHLGDGVLHPHQPLRLLVGEGAQQQRVDHAEDGRVGADAQRQGEHGHEGESRPARQGAGRETKIGSNGRHFQKTPFCIYKRLAAPRVPVEDLFTNVNLPLVTSVRGCYGPQPKGAAKCCFRVLNEPAPNAPLYGGSTLWRRDFLYPCSWWER
jgi:hypothetical protein